MNPLDIPGTVFKFEARNLTWRAASSKDGPKYKITLECDHETFQIISQANLESAAFAIAINRIDYDNNGGPVDLPKTSPSPTPDLTTTGSPKQNRRYSETEWQAIMLCQDPVFQEWATDAQLLKETGQSPDESGAVKFVKDICGVEHRADIDKSPESAKAFAGIISAFEKWKEGKKDVRKDNGNGL